MAIPVALSDLNDEMQLYLQQRLTFTPKQSYIATKLGAEPVPIVMFRIDPEREDHDNSKRLAYIPYMVAREVFPNYVFPTYEKIQFAMTTQLRPKQIDVFNEAWPFLSMYGACNLCLPTGFGKTVLGSLISSVCGDRTIIVYPLMFLGKTWYNTFMKFTNCRSICIIENHNSLPIWLSKYGDIPDVLICMVTRVDWIPADIRKRYGTLIIDEAHCFPTQIRLNNLLKFQPEYILALTATPFRQDDLFVTLDAMCAFSVTRPLDVPFTVTKFETQITPETKLRKVGPDMVLDWNFLCDWLINCEARNILICQLIQHMLEQPWYTGDGEAKPRKILVLTHRKKHVETLSKMLTVMQIAHATFYGTAESYSDEMVVIGTFKKMGIGFDESNNVSNFNSMRFNTLILTMSLKDGSSLIQSCGRCMRICNPAIIDCVDSMPLLQRHWRERKKCYAALGATFLEN